MVVDVSAWSDPDPSFSLSSARIAADAKIAASCDGSISAAGAVCSVEAAGFRAFRCGAVGVDTNSRSYFV